MSALAQLQQRFAVAIVERDASLLDGLLAGPQAQAAMRTAIYINNHHLGLCEALSAIYPVVKRLLGDDCFDLLARDHVAGYPKPTGNVLDYGAHLAELIEATAALAGLPCLADVARLEWLRHRVWHAADSAADRAPSWAGLAELDDAGLAALRLRLVPAARLHQSRFPTLRIWQQNQLPEPAPVSLAENGVKCLLLRAGLDIEFVELAAGEFAFLDALADGTVCAAAERASAVEPQFDLTMTLARSLAWLQHDVPGSPP